MSNKKPPFDSQTMAAGARVRAHKSERTRNKARHTDVNPQKALAIQHIPHTCIIWEASTSTTVCVHDLTSLK